MIKWIKRRPASIPAEVRILGLSAYLNGSIICDGRFCFVVIDGVGYYLPAKGVFRRAYYWLRRAIVSKLRKWASYHSGKWAGL